MIGTHHVIAWQKFLQKLCLLVLQGFDDELVIAGQVEERAAGSRVRQLNQGFLADRVLCERKGIVTFIFICFPFEPQAQPDWTNQQSKHIKQAKTGILLESGLSQRFFLMLSPEDLLATVSTGFAPHGQIIK